MDVIFSMPSRRTPPAQVLVARFNLFLLLWTVYHLMGGLTEKGDVNIHIRETTDEHTITDTIVDENEQTSETGRVIRLWDSESGLLLLHRPHQHRAPVFLTLTHFHCRYICPGCQSRSVPMRCDDIFCLTCGAGYRDFFDAPEFIALGRRVLTISTASFPSTGTTRKDPPRSTSATPPSQTVSCSL